MKVINRQQRNKGEPIFIFEFDSLDDARISIEKLRSLVRQIKEKETRQEAIEIIESLDARLNNKHASETTKLASYLKNSELAQLFMYLLIAHSDSQEVVAEKFYESIQLNNYLLNRYCNGNE